MVLNGLSVGGRTCSVSMTGSHDGRWTQDVKFCLKMVIFPLVFASVANIPAHIQTTVTCQTCTRFVYSCAFPYVGQCIYRYTQRISIRIRICIRIRIRSVGIHTYSVYTLPYIWKCACTQTWYMSASSLNVCRDVSHRSKNKWKISPFSGKILRL